MEALGYVWNGVQGIAHVPNIWKGVRSVLTPGGAQEMNMISDQGLYFFLGRSDKPLALPFQMWIAGEVLPAVRKTGNYLPVPKTYKENSAGLPIGVVARYESSYISTNTVTYNVRSNTSRHSEMRDMLRTPLILCAIKPILH
jgi:hypothetical protein